VLSESILRDSKWNNSGTSLVPVPQPLCFLLNCGSGRATIAALYEKYVERQAEGIALRKRPDVMQVLKNSEKDVNLKDPGHPRWWA
jgi:hypothetical protein